MNHQEKSLTIYGWLSISAALMTIALKSYAYFLTGSVGLLSDALESLINLIAAIIMLAVLHVAARPPDENHPYGHEKIEYFSSGAEGVMILIAAISIGMTAWERISNPQALQQLDIGIAISVGASMINLVVAKILINAGKRYRSITLESDGQHLMTDVWTTVGILFGIGIIYLGNSFEETLNVAKAFGLSDWGILDPIIAMFVALNIVFAGLQLITRTTAGLMDAALPLEEQTAIIQILDQFVAQHRIEYHALRTRYSGARRFMSVHILVQGTWTVQESHDLVELLEQQISQIFDNIDIDTHVEPIEDPLSFQHLQNCK
jgi:cation diffusion facilitator family transporter